jgi:hypothetical protein
MVHIVGEELSSRRPTDFLYIFGMVLIGFVVEKNKENINRFQKIQWRLNARWTPKVVFESRNMHFF